MRSVLRHLRDTALLHAAAGVADGPLLEAFITRREEAAFKALVQRHGPMVLAVCRRVLGDFHDAEDAFQATFLVLVRKAASVRPRAQLGNWLYGVAYRTAQKARAMNAKRRAKERRAAELARPVGAADSPPDELLAQLDAELSRLPDKYRAPIVLCDLQGRSRTEAARRLGWPVGTVSWRLAQGRRLLARRLSRYGAALSAGSVAALLSRDAAAACVPPSLLNCTVRAAVLTAGVVSARVVELTEGVIQAMLLSKLKLVWAVALAAVVGVGAVGLTYRQAVAQTGPSNGPARSARTTADELEELRLEVAALRKGLEAMRERVKALEERGANPAAVPPPAGGGGKPGAFAPTPSVALTNLRAADPAAVPPPAGGGGKSFDPLAQAEAALKKLRANPNDKQAADALERALKRLKERANSESSPAPTAPKVPSP
jgi:RNA polymerase sigma factor (sigma-70 family)